jgi:hypothetical protein
MSADDVIGGIRLFSRLTEIRVYKHSQVTCVGEDFGCENHLVERVSQWASACPSLREVTVDQIGITVAKQGEDWKILR